MEFEIKRVNGHFEIYIDRKFYCSVDNMKEAVTEIEEYLKCPQAV